jgi:hypothetical protein
MEGFLRWADFGRIGCSLEPHVRWFGRTRDLPDWVVDSQHF